VTEGEIQAAEAALRAAPNDPEGHVYLAFLYYAGDRFREAIALFEALLQAGYKPANQLYYLGSCYLCLGEKERARSLWERGLRSSPPESLETKLRERLERLDRPLGSGQEDY
jgi:tetratricopeptide (TPR) repeat protein